MCSLRAILFDRDGVLNVDDGYTHRESDLKWMPGAIEALVLIANHKIDAIVVTNQSGIGRGYYSEDEMHRFHQRMNAELAKAGAAIARFYFCPYHRDASIGQFKVNSHPDRKPNPGMLLSAMKDFELKPRDCVMIGDKDSDLVAAKRAGIRGFLYRDGRLDTLVENIIQHA